MSTIIIFLRGTVQRRNFHMGNTSVWNFLEGNSNFTDSFEEILTSQTSLREIDMKLFSLREIDMTLFSWREIDMKPISLRENFFPSFPWGNLIFPWGKLFFPVGKTVSLEEKCNFPEEICTKIVVTFDRGGLRKKNLDFFFLKFIIINCRHSCCRPSKKNRDKFCNFRNCKLVPETV